MNNPNYKREGFSSGLAVFFATLGSAVGLGNIWRFPYLTGEYGGGAFLIFYLLCLMFVGLPVMLGEFYIGRRTGKNAVGALKALSGANTGWKSIGFLGIFSSILIILFYSCVAGWVYSYVYKAITGGFAGITAEKAETVFKGTLRGPWTSVFWQCIALAVVAVILLSGVRKGIERATKILMPILFILIILCDIRALTLPGAMNGAAFLFHIDFSQLTGAAMLTALGLAFFKLSLGMGAMITYGSYFTKDSNMPATALRVALSDTLVSLLAGLAIFPAVFSFGMKPGAGPGLLFMTIPLVFSKMPLGNILLAIFFILSSIAATCAMLSMVEVPVAYLTGEKGVSRAKAVLMSTGAIAAVGSLAALSADKDSILGGTKILGKTFFDLFDFASSYILMPLGGLLIALYTGYFTKRRDLKSELSNRGRLKTDTTADLFHFIIRYVTPILLFMIFLQNITQPSPPF